MQLVNLVAGDWLRHAIDIQRFPLKMPEEFHSKITPPKSSVLVAGPDCYIGLGIPEEFHEFWSCTVQRGGQNLSKILSLAASELSLGLRPPANWCQNAPLCSLPLSN